MCRHRRIRRRFAASRREKKRPAEAGRWYCVLRAVSSATGCSRRSTRGCRRCRRAVGRIGDRQALGAGLAVDVVVGAGDDVEVAHLVDQRAGLGVGAGVRRGPERAADEDLVRAGRIHVGVVALVAAAVDLDLAGALVHRRVDGDEVLAGGAVARRGVGAEPGGVARARRCRRRGSPWRSRCSCGRRPRRCRRR